MCTTCSECASLAEAPTRDASPAFMPILLHLGQATPAAVSWRSLCLRLLLLRLWMQKHESGHQTLQASCWMYHQQAYQYRAACAWVHAPRIPAAMTLAKQCPPPALVLWLSSAQPEAELEPGPAPWMLISDSIFCGNSCSCTMQGGPRKHLSGVLLDLPRLEGSRLWQQRRRGLRDFSSLMGNIHLK